MGLRCLLGHDFGEREVERERREAGDEVVVVYRTVENCRRCGTRRTVSENKEVRSIRAHEGADSGVDPAPTGAPTQIDREVGTDPAAEDRGDGPATDARAGADGGGPLAGGAATDGTTTDAGPSTAAGSLTEAAESVGTPGVGGADGEDDAVIINGGSEENEAGDGDDVSADADDDIRGEREDEGVTAGNDRAGEGAEGVESTTDVADVAASEGGVELIGDDGDDGDDAAVDDGSARGGDPDGVGGWPTPDPDAEDEGYDAEPHDDTGTDVEFGGGFAPTADGNTTPDPNATGDEDATADGDVGVTFLRAENRTDADADGPTELRCPNCGTTRTAAGSSLRGGDICPDCRKGYVAERAIEE